jgi:hypothetical protein
MEFPHLEEAIIRQRRRRGLKRKRERESHDIIRESRLSCLLLAEKDLRQIKIKSVCVCVCEYQLHIAML